MALSRVVSLEHLQPWIEPNTCKTFTTASTVDAILFAIQTYSEEYRKEMDVNNYVFIRFEQIVRDSNNVFPYSTSGGSMVDTNPKAQIGTMRRNVLSSIVDIRERKVQYNDPTITVLSAISHVLTINTSCEFC